MRILLWRAYVLGVLLGGGVSTAAISLGLDLGIPFALKASLVLGLGATASFFVGEWIGRWVEE